MSYKHPEVLVETAWVAEHLKDGSTRIAEVDYDPTTNYNLGHIPGAVLFDWRKDMNDQLRRDIVSKEQLEELLGRAGVSKQTKLVLYGDFNNWFAAFAYWILKYYGIENIVLMNGGRKKWIAEDKAVTKDVPSYPRTTFNVAGPNENLRTYGDQVRSGLNNKGKILVDVRSPAEFTGEITAPPEYPNEHAQRGGHIPGAVNIPWSQAVKEDGTFKSAEELAKLYQGKGVTADKEVVTYCRIGERSSFTWFVLKYLLGYPNVRNYDGSWSEWGNIVRNPIEKP
ncbi:MAG TPA: sulfurtransferase [Candidatus Saccharimonadales bacterium]|nr:sulfurtransferase [Candidatus Saccharimonadales bacterium]